MCIRDRTSVATHWLPNIIKEFPVSYTHLDVYKRQIPNMLPVPGWLLSAQYCKLKVIIYPPVYIQICHIISLKEKYCKGSKVAGIEL